MSCNEWKEYRLEDISQIIFSGGTPSTRNEEFWDGDIPWLSSGETRNSFINKTEKTITEEGVKNSSTKLALNGDIVIASAGQGFTRGQVSFCNIDTYINQSLIAIRANNILLNNKYLYYNLKSRYNELRQISDSHSIRGSLTTKMIKDLIIKLPSLEEQEKIANILSSLDDKIELNNEMNKTLEEMAQSIFKRWFVDFEFPNEDGEPYKSSGGEMIDSELGMIPKGWEVKVLGDICDVKGGKRLPKGKIVLDEKTEYPYLRVTDITSGYVNMNSIKYIDEETREKISRYIIEYSDLYISIAGTIGLVGSINKELDGASLTENMARIICNNIEKYYMKLYLNYGEIQHLIKTRAVGSTQPKLPLYVIKDIPVLVPTDKVMNRFKEIIIPVYKSIEENLSNIETIVEIRDSLLPKLMSGEIKV